MKTIISVVLMAASLSVFAGEKQTSEIYCSNIGASVIYSQSERFPEYDGLEVKFLGLAGEEVKSYKLSELNISSRVIVKEVSKEVLPSNTICDKPYNVINILSVVKYTFTKKDGSLFFQDDTPSSDIRRVSDTMLCSQKIIDAWPCD